jgi:hypothetical protein
MAERNLNHLTGHDPSRRTGAGKLGSSTFLPARWLVGDATEFAISMMRTVSGCKVLNSPYRIG